MPNSYITLICNTAILQDPGTPPGTQTCFDTNSGASNTSAPEALVLVFATTLQYLLCQRWCFGALVPDCGARLYTVGVVPNSWTRNFPLPDLR